MNVSHLRYFKELAEQENFTRAAQRLFITQPNLTYAVNSLEKELGTILIKKNCKKFELTANGKIFFETVCRTLAVLDEGIARVSSEAPRKPLRIGATRLSLVNTALKDFRRRKENLDLEITFVHEHSNVLLEFLKSNQIDIGFTSYDPEDSTLDCTRLVDAPYVVITPVGHPLSFQESIDLRELKNYPVVLSSRTSTLAYNVQKLFELCGFEPRISGTARSTSAAARMVEGEFGVGVVPLIPEMDEFKVVTHTISYPPYINYLYAVVRKDSCPDIALSFLSAMRDKDYSRLIGKI